MLTQNNAVQLCWREEIWHFNEKKGTYIKLMNSVPHGLLE